MQFTRCKSSTDWIDAIAASSRSAISRLVVSSCRERAVSPSSAAASCVRSMPSACSWAASALLAAVGLAPPLDRGIERVERERQTLHRSVDCALLRHRLDPHQKTLAAADV